MEKTYRLYTINPWRMLLFGTLPPLVLIYTYLLVWDVAFTLDQKTNYRDFFDLTIWLLIALAAFSAFLGFKYSGYYTEIRMDDKKFSIEKIPRLKLLPATRRNTNWENIRNYHLTSDSKGNVLKIHLKDNSKSIVVGQSNLFEPEAEFLEFYTAFEDFMKPSIEA